VATALDFSIVIPAKNAEKPLGRSIECALSQNYPKGKYEVIVVDNNSTDKTAELIKQFSVKYLFQKTRGRTAACNLGVKNSKGKIIAFVDSDRFAEKNWLREAQAFFKKNAKANIAAGKVVLDKQTFMNSVMFLREVNQEYFEENGAAEGCNLFVKKKKYEELGGLEERMTIANGDVEFWEKAKSAGEEIAFLEKAIVRYNPRTFLKYLKRQFRKGRATAQHDLLRKKNLNYRFERSKYKTFKLVKKLLLKREKGTLKTLIFLGIRALGKVSCYSGQLFENTWLLADKKRKAELLKPISYSKA